MANQLTQTSRNDSLNPDRSLEELYASAPNTISKRESQQREKNVRHDIEQIAGKFLSILGTSVDYDVLIDKSRIPEKCLFRAVQPVRIVRKSTKDTGNDLESKITSLIADTRSVLIRADLSLAEAKKVVHLVRLKISDECEICYTVADSNVTIIDKHISDVRKAGRNSLYQPMEKRLPDAVQCVVTKLENLINPAFIQEKIETEMARFSLTDKFIQIFKRLKRASYDEKTALEKIIERLIQDNDCQKDSRKIDDEKSIRDDHLDQERKTEGKLAFRQIMVLLSEFIPEFQNADNTKKGEFIAAMSPYQSAKRIADEFSYINNFAKDYSDLVEYWRKELKSTKRGRPRINKYPK